MTFLQIVIPLSLSLERNLFRKPVLTFRDHALVSARSGKSGWAGWVWSTALVNQQTPFNKWIITFSSLWRPGVGGDRLARDIFDLRRTRGPYWPWIAEGSLPGPNDIVANAEP